MASTIVITAFYNNERFLRATVESVARQTLPPKEHLLVDDASTDGSLALAEQLAAQHPHVRVLRHTVNQGYPAALNTGIAASESDFVAILDGDDIALPTWLETVVPVIQSDPAIGAVGGGCIVMTEGGHLTNQHNFCNHEGDVTDIVRQGNYVMLHPGTVMRRSCLEMIGGYNPRLKSIEDGDLYMGIASVARLVHVGKPLIWYRRLRRSQSRRTEEFRQRSANFFDAKRELLEKGLSVTEANARVEHLIEALQTAPRLSPPTRGAYHAEMALAYELGGRRWMAAFRYAYALLLGNTSSKSMIGIVRCLSPRPTWEWVKKMSR